MSASTLSSSALLAACLESNSDDAWQEFLRRFHPVISATVFRAAQGHGESSLGLVEDLIQDCYVKLCANNFKLLREFKPQREDSFYAFVKVIATNIVHDYFRSPAVRGHFLSDEAALDSIAKTETKHTEEVNSLNRSLLLREVDAILRQICPKKSSRERTIFWLYYRFGMTAKAIAELRSLRLSTKGVESTIHRLTGAVREHLARTPRSHYSAVSQEKGSVGPESFY